MVTAEPELRCVSRIASGEIPVNASVKQVVHRARHLRKAKRCPVVFVEVRPSKGPEPAPIPVAYLIGVLGKMLGDARVVVPVVPVRPKMTHKRFLVVCAVARSSHEHVLAIPAVPGLIGALGVISEVVPARGAVPPVKL